MMKFNILLHPLFSKFRATRLHRRGMVRAKLHQNGLAIEDYMTVIEMAVAPASIRAMALYNRALVYYAMSNESEAIDDLKKVLLMTNATEHIRTEARRKLVRME